VPSPSLDGEGHAPARPRAGPGADLRALLERERPLVVPGCADALTALLAVDVGFQAVYATGAGISNAMLGLPDLGLASFAEICGQAARICEAVEVPVIADLDTGYGNALNARRVVRAFERAGVAAVQIEDQAFPTLRTPDHGGDTRCLTPGACVARSCAVAPAAASSSTWRTCRPTAAPSRRCC
jgi:2-methylisocitrate lyase-like PEP mutase family enzyme